MRIFDFRSWLSKAYLPLLLALLSVVLSSGALRIGLMMDDWWQRYYFLHHKTLCGQKFTDFFVQFYGADGTRESFRKCIDFGLFPWWTAENFRLFFWRPLTEITHRVEIYAWPDSPFLMHLQSLLWLGFAIYAVSLLYRRIFGPGWVAGLAALLFVFDDSHLMPAVWIADRNVTLAFLFGVVTLIFHDKWRKDNWKPGALWGPVSLLLGLLSGESAIVTCAYLFSYALFIDRGDFKKNLLSLTPYFILCLLYLAAYTMMGYGARASGGYIDPLHEPITYAIAAIERTPVFLLGQWTVINSDLIISMPKDAAKIFLYISIIFLIFTGILFIPIIAGNRASKFWGSAMVLVAFSLPGRMLMFLAIAVFGLLAQLAESVLDKSEWLLKNKPYRIYASWMLALFGFMHLLAAPCIYLIAVKMSNPFKIFVDYPANSPVLMNVDPDQQIVFVNNPSHIYTVNILAERLVKGLPMSKYYRTLADGSDTVTVWRTDGKSIIVEPKNGFMTGVAAKLWREEANMMHVGQKVVVTGVTAEVQSLTKDNRPQRVKFSFDKPLENASYKFLQWTDNGYVPFKPLSIGETAILPATKTLSEVMKTML
jgi:hypothetical protein